MISSRTSAADVRGGNRRRRNIKLSLALSDLSTRSADEISGQIDKMAKRGVAADQIAKAAAQQKVEKEKKDIDRKFLIDRIPARFKTLYHAAIFKLVEDGKVTSEAELERLLENPVNQRTKPLAQSLWILNDERVKRTDDLAPFNTISRWGDESDDDLKQPETGVVLKCDKCGKPHKTINHKKYASKQKNQKWAPTPTNGSKVASKDGKREQSGKASKDISLSGLQESAESKSFKVLMLHPLPQVVWSWLESEILNINSHAQNQNSLPKQFWPLCAYYLTRKQMDRVEKKLGFHPKWLLKLHDGSGRIVADKPS